MILGDITTKDPPIRASFCNSCPWGAQQIFVGNVSKVLKGASKGNKDVVVILCRRRPTTRLIRASRFNTCPSGVAVNRRAICRIAIWYILCSFSFSNVFVCPLGVIYRHVVGICAFWNNGRRNVFSYFYCIYSGILKGQIIIVQVMRVVLRRFHVRVMSRGTLYTTGPGFVFFPTSCLCKRAKWLRNE